MLNFDLAACQARWVAFLQQKDGDFPGISPQRVYDRLLEWRKAGKFTGGLGIYPSSGFVHIDTRARNATWKGK